MSEVIVYIVQPCRENTCHLFSSIPSGLSHSDRCFLDPCQFTFCTANENTELLTGPKVNAVCFCTITLIKVRSRINEAREPHFPWCSPLRRVPLHPGCCFHERKLSFVNIRTFYAVL